LRVVSDAGDYFPGGSFIEVGNGQLLNLPKGFAPNIIGHLVSKFKEIIAVSVGDYYEQDVKDDVESDELCDWSDRRPVESEHVFPGENGVIIGIDIAVIVGHDKFSVRYFFRSSRDSLIDEIEYVINKENPYLVFFGYPEFFVAEVSFLRVMTAAVPDRLPCRLVDFIPRFFDPDEMVVDNRFKTDRQEQFDADREEEGKQGNKN